MTWEELKHSHHFDFGPGAIVINIYGFGKKNGDGHIAFDEHVLQWEPKEERSGANVFVTIAKSEWLAIRDFLNEKFPLDAPDHLALLREARELLERTAMFKTGVVDPDDHLVCDICSSCWPNDERASGHAETCIIARLKAAGA